MKTEALLRILENTPIFRDLIKEKHRLLQQGSICRHYSQRILFFYVSLTAAILNGGN